MSDQTQAQQMSEFKRLVRKALKDDAYANRLINEKTREKALQEFGLKGSDLVKVKKALDVIDLDAIEKLRVELDDITIEIPI
jgi:hypothetical protein